ncbi:MAG TPA: GxxExxY protein [Planctomycetota bacterium]|nr:GxxExxY protein [Planctomycetota bacterium]
MEDQKEILHKDLSYAVVGAAMAVYNELGHGFLEAVYRRSLLIELRERSIAAEEEKAVPVHYHGQVVGEHRLDVLVDGKIILELKAAKAIVDEHVAQALHYLAATRLRLAIIINFGPKGLETRRLVR